jgi:hypothetical protein
MSVLLLCATGGDVQGIIAIVSLLSPRATGLMQRGGLLAHQSGACREHGKSVAFMPKAHGHWIANKKTGGPEAARVTTPSGNRNA